MSEPDTYGISPEYLKELADGYEIDQKPVEQLSSYNTKGELFRADAVKAAAEEVIGKLGDFVHRWELCGTVRRGHPMAHDGDIVLWMPDKWTVPEFQGKLASILDGQVQEGNVKFIEEALKVDTGHRVEKKRRRRSAKPKPPRKIFKFRYNGIPLEISIARGEQQFEVLIFIRTGSPEFHRHLLQKAQEQRMTVNFHRDENLNMDLYGLYGAVQIWKQDKDTGKNRPAWIVNPARLVATTERGIIEAVLGAYVEPADREVGRF